MKPAANLKLVVIDDEGRRSVIPLESNEVSIGRHSQNTVRLRQRNVSRTHARLLMGANGITVEDLRSDNGVWVNGQRIQDRHVLVQGDVLGIGDFRLEFEGLGTGAAVSNTVRKPVMSEIEATAIVRLSNYQALGSDKATGLPARFVALNTNLRGQSYVLNAAEVTLGRTSDNDIVLDHRSVSRNHIRVTRNHEDKYRVFDVGSANGVLINGEPYQELELRHGDVLTLGHLEIRFVGPGQADELEDRLALRHSIGGYWKIGVAVVVVLVAGGGLWWLRSSPEDSSTIIVQREAEPAPEGEVESLRMQARMAMSQQAWGMAKQHANGILAQLPNDLEATQILRDATLADVQTQALQRAQQALNMGDWVLAEESLSIIQEPGPWAAQVEPLRAKILEVKVASLLATAKTKLAQGAHDDVVHIVDQLVRMRVDHPDMWDLREAVDKAHKKTNKPVAMPDNRKREPQKPEKQPEAPPVKEAAAAKNTVVASAPPEPAPKPAAVVDPASAREAYTAGYNAFKAGQVDQAIEYFNRCIQQDSAFGLCYRAMGVAYSKQNNMPKAARYYRLYLKVDPDAKDAEQVRRILQSYENVP